MTIRMTPARFAALALWAAASLALSPTPARAAFVTLYDATGTGPNTSVTYESNGFFHGTLSITTVEFHDVFGHTSFTPITNGILTFALGQPSPGTPGGFQYAPGGEVLLTGSLGGGPSEVILSGTRLFGAETGPDVLHPGTFAMIFPAFFPTIVAEDFGVLFGLPGVLSNFSVRGFGAPGTVTTAGVIGGISMDLRANSAVPEPASAGMIIVGCGLVGFVGWTRGGRQAK